MSEPLTVEAILRSRHSEHDTRCRECDEPWPCLTAQLLAATPPQPSAGLRASLEREIHHAEDNGHVITDGQGLSPGQRIPGVRIDHLRAALAAKPDAGRIKPENERQAIAHDQAWQSGYAAGRAAAKPDAGGGLDVERIKRTMRLWDAPDFGAAGDIDELAPWFAAAYLRATTDETGGGE